MNMEAKVLMTLKGEKLLREELHRLKTLERPAVIEAIAEARAHGDLKENAEYHAARNKQSFIEGRIKDLESKLSRSQVIDISKLDNGSGKVIFGATVQLINLQTEQKVTYQVVGDDEGDIKAGKISVNTPLARGLIGKSAGDVVTITTPNGGVEYEIEQVNYIA